MRRTVLLTVAAALAAWAVACPQAQARIKLTTLPERERLEIQLDNPAATLVEEERVVTLLQGTNYIDFAWSNTAIDKSTIQFRVVDMPKRDKRDGDPASLVAPDGKVEMIRVINVGFPPGENALVWQVFTEKPVAARVRVSYLIANLSRSFSYRALAENDESTLTLWNYVRLDNFSGEDFGASGVFAGFGNYFQKMIGQNEAKQMLAWRFDTVPVKKTYTFDWWQGAPVPDEPDRRYVAMRYVLKNDKATKLGLFPLQPGKVRIFQKDGHGGEAFTGEDWGRFTPIDDELKLYLGLARDIEVKRKITRNDRSAVLSTVYDQDVEIRYEIRNFKNTPVTVNIVENIRRLRDELCGGKDREPEWQIPTEGTSIPQPQIERKHSSLVEFHVLAQPVAAAASPATAEPLVVTVHFRLKNEW
jgi:hypothetical protein